MNNKNLPKYNGSVIPENFWHYFNTLGFSVPKEMFDFLEVMAMGAAKHGPDNWLQKNGAKSSHKQMHDSMFHHLADSYANLRVDEESGLDPLLHLACRALMIYTRKKRGLDD